MARSANTYRANQNLTHDQKVSERNFKSAERQKLPRFLTSGKTGQIISPLDAVTKINSRQMNRKRLKRWNGIGDKGPRVAVAERLAA
jgi:hypothetical protein